MALTPRLLVHGVMKRRVELRNGFFPFERKIIFGIRETNDRSCGTFITHVFDLARSIRVFPLSNWTELDVWTYIMLQDIPVVPLYFAKERPVVQRGSTWIMADDDRMPLEPGEKPQMRVVRFRTLGCYPLTGAIESRAATLAEIVAEIDASRFSERQGRLIDSDETASMEKKKREGYF